ncbi:DUF4111 domain-containing protein (plasmid) [Deinococcus taeanensis]|uniref:aminoglycoside adenylyltransferase domain-containing protein n=1 Tax=Deinococcus taeanensis TaxID=2737050 RepID=UPI001CDB5A66|nr:aminoglycoside adenylyltransferase domain-containing protein [Deinococcus taeanensis]UBV44176.1 DUF4111 domain-containing protein [Deinococcus taeanensis]
MLPADIASLITHLIGEQRAVLGRQLLGVYLRGSLVLGDFDPQTSDIDLLCVVDRPLSERAFEAVKAMHQRVATLAHPFAHELELAYLPRSAAWAWRPGEQHPTLGRGETLAWRAHGANWLLERWAVLQGMQALSGPPPDTFIAPVPPSACRGAVRERLRDWVGFARTPDDPAWQSPRSHAAYVIETGCRMLATLESGALLSKPAAVRWGRMALPEPWAGLAQRVPEWKTDGTFDAALNAQAQAFILWAGQQADVT